MIIIYEQPLAHTDYKQLLAVREGAGAVQSKDMQSFSTLPSTHGAINVDCSNILVESFQTIVMHTFNRKSRTLPHRSALRSMECLLSTFIVVTLCCRFDVVKDWIRKRIKHMT